ncbi:MAG: hypothetical protein HY331_12590 [Chloroflexi bacterium]|nr:hypothetical protein [Chloroflexota bacterium]
MENIEQIQRHLDRLYAELAELKRHLIVRSAGEVTPSQRAWCDLMEAAEEISARWSGPSALDEIRSQREK